MQGPDIAREIWQELKRYVNEIDREDAADTLVSVLIDNDISPGVERLPLITLSNSYSKSLSLFFVTPKCPTKF